MKSTGIVRKIDELGRVVLPIELRRNLGIKSDRSHVVSVSQGVVVNTCLPKTACPPTLSASSSSVNCTSFGASRIVAMSFCEPRSCS